MTTPDIRPALTLTTPTHGVAVGVYLFVGALAVLQLAGAAEASSLGKMLGSATVLWAVGMLSSAFLALASALAALARRVAKTAMVGEAFGCAGIAAALGYYLRSLLVSYPLMSNLFTKSFAVAIIAGCIFRVAQVAIELVRLRRARAHPRPADPPPLAAAPKD